MYNDDVLPSGEIIEKMNIEYSKSDCFCEISEARQIAEIDEIYELLKRCEAFLNWLEGKDQANASIIDEKLKNTRNDIASALSCGCRRGLDYRYCCDGNFNKNCCDYCKCEMELIDKIIKILTLKNSIVDKECMIKLLKSRMDVLQFVFSKYSR